MQNTTTTPSSSIVDLPATSVSTSKRKLQFGVLESSQPFSVAQEQSTSQFPPGKALNIFHSKSASSDLGKESKKFLFLTSGPPEVGDVPFTHKGLPKSNPLLPKPLFQSVQIAQSPSIEDEQSAMETDISLVVTSDTSFAPSVKESLKSRKSSSQTAQKSTKSSQSKEKHKQDYAVSEAKKLSETIAHLTALVCKDVHPDLNHKEELLKHFSQFGNVKKVICNRKRHQATIKFETHSAAELAKKNGAKISADHKPVTIYWHQDFSRKGKGSSEEKKRPDNVEVSAELKAMLEGAGDHNILDRPTEAVVIAQPVRRTEKPKPKISIQLLQERTYSEEDRYKILDTRDSLLRANLKRHTNFASAKDLVGTCCDMCPEKERYGRYTKNFLSLFEKKDNEKDKPCQLDHKVIVKEYSRSSAAQEEPLPHEMRPAPTLQMTMDYLLCNVMDKMSYHTEDWYDFIWNRTRAIRKDITQQSLCNVLCMSIVEKCARFHIHCAAVLCEEEARTFDPKINDENLTKCLQTLKHMYQDLAEKHMSCPNEAEFRAYDILLSLKEGDTLTHVQHLHVDVRNTPELEFAVSAAFAFSNHNYVRFFKLVEETTYLNACILQRYFHEVRLQAMQIMLKAFCSPSRPELYPLENLCHILKFSSTSEAEEFCGMLGFKVADQYVQLDRLTFAPPAPSVVQHRSALVEGKRKQAVSEIINNGPLPANPIDSYVPHSSFDSKGYLKKEAYQALDQMKIVEMDVEAPLHSAEIAASDQPLEHHAEDISDPVLKPLEEASEVSDDSVVPPSTTDLLKPSVTEIIATSPGHKLKALAAKTIEVPKARSPAKAKSPDMPKLPCTETLTPLADFCGSDPSVGTFNPFSSISMEGLKEAIWANWEPFPRGKKTASEQDSDSEFDDGHEVCEPPEVHVSEEQKLQPLDSLEESICSNGAQEEKYTVPVRLMDEEPALVPYEIEDSNSLDREFNEETIDYQDVEMSPVIMSEDMSMKEKLFDDVCDRLCEDILEEHVCKLGSSIAEEVYNEEIAQHNFKMNIAKRIAKIWYRKSMKKKLEKYRNIFPSCPPLMQVSKKSVRNVCNPIHIASHVMQSVLHPLSHPMHHDHVTNNLVAALFHQTIKEEITWKPYDLSSLFERCIRARVQLPRLTSKGFYWKLVLMYEEDDKESDLAYNQFVQWLCSKFTKDHIKQKDSVCGLNSLYWLTNVMGDRIAICVRSIAFKEDFFSTMIKLKEENGFEGACSVLLCLKRSSIEDSLTGDILSAVRGLLSTKQLIPAVPLYCYIAGKSKRSYAVVEQHLTTMKKQNVLHEFKVVSLEDTQNFHMLNEQVIGAVEWLVMHCPPFPEMKIENLHDFIQKAIVQAFNIIYKDLAHTKNQYYLMFQPLQLIVEFFNFVMKRMASVLKQELINKVSWPLPEVPADVVDVKEFLKKRLLEERKDGTEMLLSLCLPPFIGEPTNIDSVLSYIQDLVSTAEADPLPLLSSVYHKLSKVMQNDLVFDEIPWADVLHECIQFFAENFDTNGYGKPQTAQICYLAEDMEKIDLASAWQRMQLNYCRIPKRKFDEEDSSPEGVHKRMRPHTSTPKSVAEQEYHRPCTMQESVSEKFRASFLLLQDDLDAEKRETEKFLCRLKQLVSPETSIETQVTSQELESSELQSCRKEAMSYQDLTDQILLLKNKVEIEAKEEQLFSVKLQALLS